MPERIQTYDGIIFYRRTAAEQNEILVKALQLWRELKYSEFAKMFALYMSKNQDCNIDLMFTQPTCTFDDLIRMNGSYVEQLKDFNIQFFQTERKSRHVKTSKNVYHVAFFEQKLLFAFKEINLNDTTETGGNE